MDMKQLLLYKKEKNEYEIKINEITKKDMNLLFSNFNNNSIKYNSINNTWKISEELYEKLKNKFTIDSYLNLGSSMKLQPYEYQKEVVNFILNTKNVLAVLPCGAGIFLPFI